MNKYIHIIYTWTIVGCIWGMDIGAMCMRDHAKVMLTTSIYFNGTEFYHVFMYAIFVLGLAYPLWVVRCYEK